MVAVVHLLIIGLVGWVPFAVATESEPSLESSAIDGTSSSAEEDDTANDDSSSPTFLNPDDFVRGSMIMDTDAGSDTVDPIPESGKFEGDIDLRGLPYAAYVDKIIDDSPYKSEKEIGSTAIRNKWFHWPNAEIPYEIESSHFSRYDKGVIASAVADYNRYTCIRWIQRQSHHRNYVSFMAGGGCFSSIGRAGGKQNLSLGRGCVTKGIAIHEMMHAAGFFHEQARADRNDYVTIVWDNVQAWARGNFQMMSLKQIDHLGTSYSYDSIMHYGKNYFSRNGRDTIIVKNAAAKIGQRRGFSDTDIQKLNKLYKCLEAMKPVTTPRPLITPGICGDDNEHCEGWAKRGYCSTSVYTKRHCKRSCSLCNTETDCYDSKKSCEFWKSEGYCTKDYVAYMNRYCKKSCGKC